MFSYALKSFLQDKTKLFIAVIGIAFSLVLILLIYGIFKGTEEQVLAYIKNTRGDLWVMQKGVSTMHMSSSAFPEFYAAQIKKEKEVKEVYKIVYLNNVLKVGGKKYFAYFLGFEPAKKTSGPWKMAEGDKNVGLNEIIIDEKIAQESKLKIGDSVKFMGQSLEISGLSEETYSLASSYIFLNYRKLQELFKAEKIASYMIVDLREGQNPREFAKKIKQKYPDLNAISKPKLMDSEGKMIRRMGIETIRVLSVIAYIIGFLVIAFTVYTLAVERTREFGIIKAIGARNTGLYAIVLFQSLTSAIFGLIIGVFLSYGGAYLIERIASELLIIIAPSTIVRISVAIVLISIFSASIPVYKVSKVDPLIAFRE